MPDRFNFAERTAHLIKQHTQCPGMVWNLYGGLRLIHVLAPHLEARTTSDSFDGTFERRRAGCQFSTPLFSHLCEPKLDRRAPAIDHQDVHVAGEALYSVDFIENTVSFDRDPPLRVWPGVLHSLLLVSSLPCVAPEL